MGKVIIDSYALVSVLFAEKNHEVIAEFLKQAQKEKKEMVMSAVNFGEVYYTVLRRKGEKEAEKLEEFLISIPVFIVDADTKLTKEAARFKAFKKMSYADCHAAALAKTLNAPVLTGDKEFKEVEKEIKIIWV
jgi:uncharacterized protein